MNATGAEKVPSGVKQQSVPGKRANRKKDQKNHNTQGEYL